MVALGDFRSWASCTEYTAWLRGNLHADNLSDNKHSAPGNPRCYDWAAGGQKQCLWISFWA